MKVAQGTCQLKEELQAELEKRQHAEKENSRLWDELLKKEEELILVKSHHAEIQKVLKTSADAAEYTFKEIDKRLTSLRKSVHQFMISVFGKLVSLEFLAFIAIYAH